MVDTSALAVGGVLHQYQCNMWMPLGFFSKKLRPPETKYSAFDRELLAVYLSVKHFHHFVEGREFHVLTDHKPLTFCLTSKTERSSPRQIRHLEFIAEFTTDIRHVAGSDNPTADALSRLVVDSVYKTIDLDYEALAVAQTTDPDLHQCLNHPCGLRLRQMELINSKYVLWCDVSTGKPRPFIPTGFRRSAYNLLHNLSHPSGRATRKLITARFVWPKMNSNIALWARTCIPCQKAKVSRHTASPIMPFMLPDRRFNQVHADIVGPLSFPQGQRYILTCVDGDHTVARSDSDTRHTSRHCRQSVFQRLDLSLRGPIRHYHG